MDRQYAAHKLRYARYQGEHNSNQLLQTTFYMDQGKKSTNYPTSHTDAIDRTAVEMNMVNAELIGR